MIQIGSNFLDFSPIWTFFLLLARFGGMLSSLPGIGTEQISTAFRFWPSVALALVVSLTGVQGAPASGIETGTIMIFAEFTLGYALGSIPAMVLGGLSVAGQVSAAAIGLAQANLIDRSLGTNVSVVAKLYTLTATMVFLLLIGHHIIIRAGAGIPGQLGLGVMTSAEEMAQVLLHGLSNSFELAVMIAAPILVTTLITQFILGLITKFVPQVNIFIVSLPLGILVGLFLMEHNMGQFINLIQQQFAGMDQAIARVLPSPN